MTEILLRLLSSIVPPFGLTIEQEVAWVNACQSSSRFRVRFLGVAAIGRYPKILFVCIEIKNTSRIQDAVGVFRAT